MGLTLSPPLAVLAACERGDLSPGEAREIMGLIATHVQAMGAARVRGETDRLA